MQTIKTSSDSGSPFSPTVAAIKAAATPQPTSKTFGGGNSKAAREAAREEVAKIIPDTTGPTDAAKVFAPESNRLGGVSYSTSISLKTLARRYRKIITKAQLDAIAAAASEFRRQQAIQNEHSPSLQADRVRKLSHQYAESPTTENLEALRHAKTLEPFDHTRVQQLAKNQMGRIYKEQIVPLEKAIYPLFVQAVEADLDTVMRARLQLYAEFECAPPSDQLIEDLGKIARLYRLMIQHRNYDQGIDSSALPELFVALAEANSEK